MLQFNICFEKIHALKHIITPSKGRHIKWCIQCIQCIVYSLAVAANSIFLFVALNLE